MITRTHRLAHTLLALTTLLVLSACEDAATVGDGVDDGIDGNGSDFANSPAAGHWFFCETADCSVLDKDGIGLLGDGSYARLNAVEGDTLEEGAGYCMETDDRDWTWTWADGVLQLDDGSGLRTAEFAVDGDRATIRIVDTGEAEGPQPMKRVDPNGLTGDCPAGL